MKKHFFFNLTTNLLIMFVSLFLSFWLTPYLINRLSAEAYSFVPLIQTSINYFAIITIVINSMVARFFTYSIKRNDFDGAQQYISTSVFAALILCFVLAIPIILFVLNVNKILNIPTYLITDVRWSLAIQGFTFLITTIASPFGSAAYSENKIYINNIIRLVSTFARAIIIVLFLVLLTPLIWYVSLGNLIGSLLTLVLVISSFKKLLPDIAIRKKYFNWTKLYELITSGVWNSVLQIGSMLFLQIDALVGNLNLGPAVAGEYLGVIQIPLVIRSLSNTIASVFSPVYVKLYAEGRIQELQNYSKKAIFFTGLVCAIPIGLVCAYSENILTIWLGSAFSQYSYLLVLLVGPLSLNLGTSALFSLQLTYNRVKIPAFVTLGLGLLNFFLAFMFTGPLKLGVIGLAITGILTYTLINFFFTPIYMAMIMKQSKFIFYPSIFRPVVGAFVIFVMARIIGESIAINNWTTLIIGCCFSVVTASFIIYIFLLTSEERSYIKLKYHLAHLFQRV